MKTVAFLNDIIRASYLAVMRKKTSHNRLELLRRYLKYKYNISVSLDTLEKRHENYQKEK
jgi:hypothetical protein